MVDLQEPQFPMMAALAPVPMFWTRILLRGKNDAPLIFMFLDANYFSGRVTMPPPVSKVLDEKFWGKIMSE